MNKVIKIHLGERGVDEPRAINEGIVMMGWTDEDVTDSTLDEIKSILHRDYPNKSYNSISIIANMIFKFVNGISTDDYVLSPLKTRQGVAIGKITGPCTKSESRGEHVIPVEWLRLDIDKSALGKDLQSKLRPPMTMSEVQVRDVLDRVEQIVSTGKDPGPSGYQEQELRGLEYSQVTGSVDSRGTGDCNAEPMGYSVEDIVKDGCFMELERIDRILKRLQTKKNLILQGPPGTGKTWLAKRLAWALVSHKDEKKVRAVQFHPNLSYEDFVRGWRPSSEGKLDLVDGPFLEMVKAAKEDRNSAYVLVVEEINRGNPAQILGEILTLLEADKRSSDNALELTYRQEREEGIYLPPNLHVVGTMNIADRSLALVDLALRRRFAFIDLKPEIGERWKAWVREQCGFGNAILSDIQERMSSLNETIEADPKLGRQFQIGHSYVTPLPGRKTHPSSWYRDVVEAEIGPLLDEYWFDDLDRAAQERGNLLAGLEWL